MQNNKGNSAEYDLENVAPLKKSPLKGLRLGFLGSSVTLGSASGEVSFADYIAKRNRCKITKEAVSGTTLVDNGPDSYVQRLIHNISKRKKFDAFICQLSTNDASLGIPMGEISDSRSLDAFDTSTIIGAIEFIICYVRVNWDCSIIFYTGTRFDNPQYAEMVEILHLLEKKWNIGVIDLWNNLDVNIPEYDLYMADPIHPTRAGYLNWWTPYMEKEIFNDLIEYFNFTDSNHAVYKEFF